MILTGHFFKPYKIKYLKRVLPVFLFIANFTINFAWGQLSEFECIDLIRESSQLLKDKDYPKAIENLDKVIRSFPGNSQAHLYRGVAYLGQKEYRLAVNDFNLATTNPDVLLLVYLNRAVAYQGLNEINNAINDLNQALKLSPDNAQAYYLRGYLYANKKDYFNAINDLNEAIKLDPDSSKMYLARSSIYLRTNKFNESLNDCNKALKIDPDSGDAYVALASIKLKQKNYKAALENLNSVLEKDPKNTNALFARSKLYADLKQYDKAIADCNKIIEIEPKFYNAYYLDGTCYFMAKDFKTATKLLNHAARHAGSHKVYACILGYLAYANLNDKEKADKILNLAVNNQTAWPQPVLQYLKGKINESQLFKAAKNNEELTEAHCYVGLNSMLKGFDQVAKHEFEWVVSHGNNDFTEYTLAKAFVDSSPQKP